MRKFFIIALFFSGIWYLFFSKDSLSGKSSLAYKTRVTFEQYTNKLSSFFNNIDEIKKYGETTVYKYKDKKGKQHIVSHPWNLLSLLRGIESSDSISWSPLLKTMEVGE